MDSEATYGQTVYLSDGSVSVSGSRSPEEATERAVHMAISSGWRAPRWWEFWNPPCPAHVREEYLRQIGRTI